MTTPLRPELPELPLRMRSLPVDKRGYPVPWFVEWIDGEPDFRVISKTKIVTALRGRLCWICGGTLGRYHAFAIGPMCVVNRITSEPPCHLECATFAAQACPFLVRPHAKRREAGLPEGASVGHAAGVMIPRNPGVTCVFVTRTENWFRVPPSMIADGAGDGILCELGEPTGIAFYREGRLATRAECEESIRSGLPSLEAMCREEKDFVALREAMDSAMRLLPEAES